MNKQLLILVLILVPTILFAQATKRVRDRGANETYHVLRSDENIRHGEYRKFDSKRRLLISGQYKLGERDGFWIHFTHPDNTVAEIYCYTEDGLIYQNPDLFHDTTRYRVIIDGNIISTTLCSPPVFLRGEKEMFRQLANTTQYPTRARESGIFGTVIVLFTIDKFGKASNHRIGVSLGQGVDEAAIDAYKALPNTWLPGILNGEPVDVVVGFPVKFTMSR